MSCTLKQLRAAAETWKEYAPDDAPNFAAKCVRFLDANSIALDEMDLIGRARAHVVAQKPYLEGGASVVVLHGSQQPPSVEVVSWAPASALVVIVVGRDWGGE